PSSVPGLPGTDRQHLVSARSCHGSRNARPGHKTRGRRVCRGCGRDCQTGARTAKWPSGVPMNGLFTLSQGAIPALLQVIMIDLVLAGDNAIVIGLAAAGLAPERRGRVVLVGILAATVLRILFAAF